VSKLPYQMGVLRGIPWLWLVLLLLLPLSLAWAAGVTGRLPEWSVGPASLLRYTDTCNLVGDNFIINDDAGVQGQPRIAYNSRDNTFLVVWQSRTSSTAKWNVCGQMLTYTGTVLSGQSFCLGDLHADRMYPAVDYNSTRNEFIVVWQDKNTPNDSWDIYGQLVTASGMPTGSVFTVVSRPDPQGFPTDQQRPAVTYNPGNLENPEEDEYLVVWQDNYCHFERWPYTTAYDIYGVRLSNSGRQLSDYIRISIAQTNCSDPAYQQFPAVAHASDAHQYLVVWEDSRQGNLDIYGQRIADDGTLIGGNCVLVTGTGDQSFPDLIYNGQVYLLTWQDHRGSDWDIYAERVPIGGQPQWPFPISTKLGDQELPAVTYSPSKSEYLIVWQDNCSSDKNIYSQRVAVNDVLLGDECPIAVTGGDQTNPAISYSSQYIVVWQDDRAGKDEDDVYGQRVALGPPLTVTASAQLTSGCVPLLVNFTGSASGGTGPYSYSWVFGDGGTSNQQSPSHIYNNERTYTATLTVADVHDCQGMAQVVITIYPKPTAIASAQLVSGCVPLSVSFTGTATGGTAPYSYRWDFGDDNLITITQSPVHTYNRPGTYTATLTVTDIYSCLDTDQVTITVYADPPCRWRLYLPVIMKKYVPPTPPPTPTYTPTPIPTIGIRNGDFETGDFTCWVHGGSYPQSVVERFHNGEWPYQGRYCASLGTPQSCALHPEASAWMSQDFYVPDVQGTVTISFTYRIFTNEAIEWNYFYVELQTTSGALLRRILEDGNDCDLKCSNDLGWKTFPPYDLSVFKGMTIRLYFENCNRYNTGLGIWTYVDDIKLIY